MANFGTEKEDPILKAIESHLNAKYEEFIEQKVEEVSQEIRRKMKAEQGRMVLMMLENYDVEKNGLDLRIQVRNFYKKPEDEG